MATGSRTWPMVAALTLSLAGQSMAASPGSSGGGRRPPALRDGVSLEIDRSIEKQVESSLESDPPVPAPTRPGGVPPKGGVGGGVPGGVKVAPPARPLPVLPAKLSQKVILNLSLRFLLDMRVTDREIAAALPLLKEMRAAEAALEAECEQALEADNQALLAAKPGSVVSTENRDRWRQALARYQARDAELWQKLGAATSERTAWGLRGLLGRGKLPLASGGKPAYNLRSVLGAEGQITQTPPRDASPSASSRGYAPATPPKLFGNPYAGEGRTIRPDPVSGLQARLSLAELIDLLERKLQAMQPSA